MSPFFATGILLVASYGLPLRTSAPRDTANWGYAPVWVDLKRDAHGRHAWLRLQRNADSDDTESRIYVDGKLVSSNTLRFTYMLENWTKPDVAQVGDAWMIFVLTHPGAGSDWCDDYNLIDCRTYRTLCSGCFDHGDASHFPQDRRFVEYRWLRPRYQSRLGRPYAFQRVVWHWNTAKRKFFYVTANYTNDPIGPGLTGWGNYTRVHDLEELAFKPAEETTITGLQGFGLPSKMTLEISALLSGSSGLRLYLDHKVAANLPLILGEIEVHRPPRIVQTPEGPVLTFAVFEHDHVRRYDVRLDRSPYKLTMLGSRIEKEWTPFLP